MALTSLTNLQPLHVHSVGISTFDGSVSVGGTLTYEDVTNVDALGIGTFRSGINVSGGQLDVGSNIKIGNAGVVTATTFIGNLTGNPTGSGANLTNLPAANLTGTLPAISGANLTNLPAANLTGTLPAISGANLTSVDADTVDGLQATSFLRSDASDTATGTITFSSTGGTYGPIITSNSPAGPKLSINATATGGKHWMWISNGSSNTDGAGYLQAWNYTDSFSPVTFGATSNINTKFRTGLEIDGNLKLASGHGIDFSADGNSSGMTSELLDDYEEGSFTVSVKSVNGGVMNGSYSQQSGRYTKIGRMVHIRFDMTWSGWTNASGAIQIDNLPFTNQGVSSSGGYGAPQFRDCSGLTNDIKVNGNSSWFENNSNRIRIMAWNSSGVEYYITPNQSGRVTGEGIMYTEV